MVNDAKKRKPTSSLGNPKKNSKELASDMKIKNKVTKSKLSVIKPSSSSSSSSPSSSSSSSVSSEHVRKEELEETYENEAHDKKPKVSRIKAPLVDREAQNLFLAIQRALSESHPSHPKSKNQHAPKSATNTPSSAPDPVFLSRNRTTTNRLAEQAARSSAKRDAALLKKRIEAQAHVIPVYTTKGVAQNAPGSATQSFSPEEIATRIALERRLLETATRGTVSLFNSVTKYQKGLYQDEDQQGTTAKNDTKKNTLSKDDFFDLVSKGVKNTDQGDSRWNALRDDFDGANLAGNKNAGHAFKIWDQKVDDLPDHKKKKRKESKDGMETRMDDDLHASDWDDDDSVAEGGSAEDDESIDGGEEWGEEFGDNSDDVREIEASSMDSESDGADESE